MLKIKLSPDLVAKLRQAEKLSKAEGITYAEALRIVHRVQPRG